MNRIVDLSIVKEKVPWFGKAWGKIILLASYILPFLAYLIFFWWFDHLFPYGALISQFVSAIFLCVVLYLSMRHLIHDIRLKCKKNNVLPNWVMPLMFVFIAAPWNALLVHPLMVSANTLLPLWFIAPFALFIIFFSLLMYRPSISGGFSLAHVSSIYLFFPEEGTRINEGIFSYLRHPRYAALVYMAFGFALLRNNMLAILTALIYVFPIFLEIKFEDEELIERFGEEHRRYVKETPAIFPHVRNIGKFFILVLLGK